MAAKSEVLPHEIRAAMQGAFPAHICSCSLDGSPNATLISQVYYVDERHIALSNQFFSKTARNVRENPVVAILLTEPESFDEWYLEARFERSESQGPVFETMDAQIEAIASLTGMSDILKLKAADIFEVLSVSRYGGAASDPGGPRP
jgi:hypothetical protein